MITVTDEQVIAILRAEIAAAVERERPLIMQEVIDSFKWVTEETGATLLQIEGTAPQRAFRRLMNTYGVEKLKLGLITRYRWKRSEKKDAGLSIEELVEQHVVRSGSKRKAKLKVLEHASAA